MNLSDDNNFDVFVMVMSEIIESLNKAETIEDALSILSAVTALMICQGMTSADAADEAYEKFMSIVGATMHVNEANGSANWTRGTSH